MPKTGGNTVCYFTNVPVWSSVGEVYFRQIINRNMDREINI